MYSSRKKRACPKRTCKGPTLQAMHASPPSTPSIVMCKPSRTQNSRKKHITQHTYMTPPLASCLPPPPHPFYLLPEMYVSKCIPKDQYHSPSTLSESCTWMTHKFTWLACHNSKYPSRAYLCWPTILHYLTLNNIEAQGHLEVQLHIQGAKQGALPPQPIQ